MMSLGICAPAAPAAAAAADEEDGAKKEVAPPQQGFTVRVAADLGEFALFVSGRPADVWWPDEASSRMTMTDPSPC